MSYSHANLTPPPSLPPSHQPTTYPRRLPMAASTRIPQPTLSSPSDDGDGHPSMGLPSMLAGGAAGRPGRGRSKGRGGIRHRWLPEAGAQHGGAQ
jgi:hypothetical protein